jgi:hypothetical protein
MEGNLPPLIIGEDIYDLDTITLGEKIEEIKRNLPLVQKLQSQTEEVEDWIERAEGLIEMGSLELEERAAVENFGEVCRNSDFF